MEERVNKKVKITLYVLLAVVAVVALTMAFLLNYNTFTPEKIEVFSNSKVNYISAKANENCQGYRFKFILGEETIVFDWKDNIITIDECVEQGAKLGETYKISYCYIAENEGNNSKYSNAIDWKAQYVLSAPQITYDATGNAIHWEQVPNADFYTLYYNDATTKSVRVETNRFPMSEVPTGSRNFYVVASSESVYYATSDASNELKIDVKRNINQFTSISFDVATTTLTLTGNENVDKIIVYINDESYEVVDFDKTTNADGSFTYKKDLKTIYSTNARIGVAPVGKDEFNIFDGEILYL